MPKFNDNLGIVDISPSELKVFGRCKLQWFLKYVMRLRLRKTSSRALFFGSVVHEALEHYYNPSLGPRSLSKLMDGLTQAVDPETALEQHGEMANIRRVLQSYYRVYQNEDWNSVVTEVDFRVGIFDQDEITGFIHGRLDMVLKSDKVWIVDHKTTGRFSFDHLEYDPQMDMYALAGKKLYGEEFGGVFMNFIRSKPSKTRENFTRLRLRRDGQYQWIERNIASSLRAMAGFDPTRDLYANFTKNCSWDCRFLTVCRALRSGQANIRGVIRNSYIVPPEEHHNDDIIPSDD